MASLWHLPKEVSTQVTLSNGDQFITTKTIYIPLVEPNGNWFVRSCNLGSLLHLIPKSTTKTQVKRLLKDAPTKYARLAAGEFYVIDHKVNGVYVFAFDLEIREYLLNQGFTDCDASGKLPITVRAGRHEHNYGIFKVPVGFALKLKLAAGESKYYLKVFP